MKEERKFFVKEAKVLRRPQDQEKRNGLIKKLSINCLE
jgi:hypothetical protein